MLVTSANPSGTLNFNSNITGIYTITALTNNIVLGTDSGSPSNGQRLVFRIKTLSGTPSLGLSSSFRTFVQVPTTLTAGYTLYIACMYNSDDSLWDVIASKQGI